MLKMKHRGQNNTKEEGKAKREADCLRRRARRTTGCIVVVLVVVLLVFPPFLEKNKMVAEEVVELSSLGSYFSLCWIDQSV